MKMNKKQVKVLWIGIAIVVLMALFPPQGGYVSWRYDSSRPQRGPVEESRYSFDGYGFILSSSGRIDIGRLCLQWVLVAVLTGGLIYTLGVHPDLFQKIKQKSGKLNVSGDN